MVGVMGVAAGSTTLAALLLRPGLPGTPTEPAAPAFRVQRVSNPVAFSMQAQQSADRAKQTVTALEADGARWSAAFGRLLHQRMLALLSAEVDQAFASDAPAPTPRLRGGAVALAA